MGRDRRVRDLLHASARRAVGAAGVQGRERPVRHEARPSAGSGRLRERPGAGARQEPRPARRIALGRRGLRRRPRRHDSLHRDERRSHRRVADHVLDVDLPPAARGVPPAAPEAEDAVAVADRLRRRAADPLRALRSSRFPRPDVRVRRDALVHDRARLGDRAAREDARRGDSLARAAQPPDPRGELAAVRAARRPRHRHRVARRRRPGPRDPLCGLRAGSRSASSSIRCTGGICTVPLAETVRAPIVLGPAAALEYRNILVPVVPGRETQEALDVACRLATERRARVAAVAVVEVPLELPLDAAMEDAEAQAHELLDYARTVGDSYGVDVVGRIGARPARRPRDRARGRAAKQRDRRHGRAAPQAGAGARLRRHDGLRAEARAVPGDGRRRARRGVNRFHRAGTTLFGVAFVAIGVALLVVTAIHGGGVFGFLIGALFVAAGAGRLYLLRAWLESFRGFSAGSARPTCSESLTGRSRARSTSRSGSSPGTRSA